MLRNLILLGNLCFKSIAKTLAFFEHLHGLTALFRTGCKTSLSWVRLKDSFLPEHWQIPWKPDIWRNQIEQSSLKAWESPRLDLPLPFFFFFSFSLSFLCSLLLSLFFLSLSFYRRITACYWLSCLSMFEIQHLNIKFFLLCTFAFVELSPGLFISQGIKSWLNSMGKDCVLDI